MCILHCQEIVVPHLPCLMVRDLTLAPLMGAQSPIPVTQGTVWRQVVQGEHVNQVAGGQEAIQHVPVCSILETLSHKHTMIINDEKFIIDETGCIIIFME